MHDCQPWLALTVAILKIVHAVLEMWKARRSNGEPPQQS